MAEPTFDLDKFYVVVLSRACEVLKTEYPAHLPFKASGEMAKAFSDQSALLYHEEVNEDDAIEGLQRTDNRMLRRGPHDPAVVRPDSRTLHDAVAELSEEEQSHFYEKQLKLHEMGQ